MSRAKTLTEQHVRLGDVTNGISASRPHDWWLRHTKRRPLDAQAPRPEGRARAGNRSVPVVLSCCPIRALGIARTGLWSMGEISFRMRSPPRATLKTRRVLNTLRIRLLVPFGHRFPAVSYPSIAIHASSDRSQLWAERRL